MEASRIQEHDSELAKLHELRAATAPAVAPTKQQIAEYSVECAKLVIAMVDGGHVKSVRRYAMAKAVVAAGVAS